jgi:hypothetical protein
MCRQPNMFGIVRVYGQVTRLGGSVQTAVFFSYSPVDGTGQSGNELLR